MSLTTILLIVLIVILLGGGFHGYRSGYFEGYGAPVAYGAPSLIVILVVVLLVLLVMGRL